MMPAFWLCQSLITRCALSNACQDALVWKSVALVIGRPRQTPKSLSATAEKPAKSPESQCGALADETGVGPVGLLPGTDSCTSGLCRAPAVAGVAATTAPRTNETPSTAARRLRAIGRRPPLELSGIVPS